MAVDHYGIHGASLAVRTDHPALRSFIRDQLSTFARDDSNASPVLDCFLTADDPGCQPELSVPAGLEPRLTEDGSSYYISGNRSFFATEDGAVGMADFQRQRMVLHLQPEYLDGHRGCAQSGMFRLLLLDLLRTSGIVPLHAGAVALDDEGILVTAFSGGGKSTFTIALTRAGLKFLGDDVVLLRREGTQIAALLLPNPIQLSLQSISFFPELAPLGVRPLNNRGKLSFSVQEAYPDRSIERCVPRLLLFPRLIHQPASHLERLSPMEALCRLLPQSLWEAESVHGRQHWDLLGQLVEQCTPYEIALGTDLDAAAELAIRTLQEGRA